MGGRRDLPITSSVWMNRLSDEEWGGWESEFGQQFDAKFRTRVNLCLLDFQAIRSRHYSEDRVSASDLRKRIKRLIKMHSDNQPLDDPFAEDQVLKNNLGNEEAPFSEQAENTLDLLNEKINDVTMDAPKPEALFTSVIFKLFEDAGMPVNLTSGSKRDLANGLDEVDPTPIERFILRYILEIELPIIKNVDLIRKNIKRLQ